MDPLLDESTFRCRKCRVCLFSIKQLQSHKPQRGSMSVDLSSFNTCSSWFLTDDDMLPWINESVEEAQWTEGKLYCPKCKSRIGAFDFIHGIQCNCGKFVIPAVWIQKCRVDHILPKKQAANLDIRKPVVYLYQSAKTYSRVTSEAVHNKLTSSCSHSVQDIDYSDGPQNIGRDKDSLQFASSTNLQSPSGTDEGTEGKDNGQTGLSCNSCLSVICESESSSCDLLSPVERNFTLLQDGHVNCRISCNDTEHCKKCYAARMHQVHSVEEQEKIERQSSRCCCSCATSCVDASLETNSATRQTQYMLNNKESHVQRSKRKRKGRQNILALEDANFDFHAEINIEPQVSQPRDQMTYYSYLTVDEGFDETRKAGVKVAMTTDIPDCHCCAVCLDLLYEPFKCSCDHVFCDPCLRQLNFRTSSGGTIRCPLCRQIVQHITPATELRREIRSKYDSHILRKRDKAERRAPHRKWPLPANQGPLRRRVSRNQRTVTLPCVISTFLMCACVYTLVMIALMSNLAANDVIMMY